MDDVISNTICIINSDNRAACNTIVLFKITFFILLYVYIYIIHVADAHK